MAGSYPDVPGYKFAYDIDGTQVQFHSATLATTVAVSATIQRVINAEDVIANSFISNFSAGNLIFLFPEQRNISGIMINTAFSISEVQWSNNTTNGLDGTWTTIAGFTQIADNSRTAQRTNIRTVSITGASAFRINFPGNTRINNVHIYGSIPTTNSPDRLLITDLSNADIAAQLDFGNIPQRNNVTRQFKVTNHSSTLTANNITVSLEAPTNATPSLIGQYQVSTDNIAFANAVNIGSLAPGTSSGTMYLRDSVSSTAMLGVWTARMIAHPTSWS